MAGIKVVQHRDKYRWLRRFLFAGAMAATAQVLIATDQTATAAVAPTQTENTKFPMGALAAQIDAVIEARTKLMDRSVPQPAANCTDAELVARRIGALEELDAFTRQTIGGLIDAAPAGESRAAAREQLAPLLSRHNQKIGALLADLTAMPIVHAQRALAARVSRLADQVARSNPAFLGQD